MDMLNLSTGKRASRGFTLIEVLVGIIIFALGMLALAQLQGTLAKNSADANARTVANNIAEEVIEAARTFGQITSDGVHDAYNDIVDGVETIERGGVNYTVTSEVTDYYYDADESDFSTEVVAGFGRSDFKLLELTVSWNTGQILQIDGNNSTTNTALGSGQVRLNDAISSITTASGGKIILSNPGSSSYGPPVDYNPGENPDIISIQLGANKFKESTTPLPDVVRSAELVETRFDVVTYSQDDEGATFLRREEFRAISCECSLHVADADGDGGLRPTVWEGNVYTEAEYVAKAWGESANQQQSDFCSLCCRDHHDGGTGENDQVGDPGRSLYNAFRDSDDYHADGAFAGDHKHYNRNNSGVLVLADSDGDTYVEACRMIRKDGYFRIAQDLRQEGLNAFPASYLDEEAEVSEYSEYVTDVILEYEDSMAVHTHYELTPPVLTDAADMATPLVFPASTYETASVMHPAGLTEQQLRSLGIYLDYMTDDLRVIINCLEASGGDGEACGAPNVTTTLEVIPFYDVQLTWLSRWNETPNNSPIDVTNEAIENNNEHSRGVAGLEGGGDSIVDITIHSGNLGLTGTDPIDPWYVNEEEFKNLYILADDSESPPLSDVLISGTISSAVGGVKAADVEVEASGAQCDRTNTGYECYLIIGANNPRLIITNYYKANKVLLACSVDDVLENLGSDTSPKNLTRFNLPAVTTPDANIVIMEDACL